MTGNVIMPSKFLGGLDEQGIQQLEDSGIAIDRTAEFDDLDLSDPTSGDITIGTLTPEETDLFVNYHQAYAEFDEHIREINSDMLRTAADHIKQGDFNPSNLPELAQERMNDDEIKLLSRLRRQVDVLRSLFFWHVSERLDAHHHTLGVRSGGRVVRRIGQG